MRKKRCLQLCGCLGPDPGPFFFMFIGGSPLHGLFLSFLDQVSMLPASPGTGSKVRSQEIEGSKIRSQSSFSSLRHDFCTGRHSQPASWPPLVGLLSRIKFSCQCFSPAAAPSAPFLQHIQIFFARWRIVKKH